VCFKNFKNGANSTKTNYNEVVSSFPSFLVQEIKNETIGFLSFGGMMCGDMEKLFGVWSQSNGQINDGMEGMYFQNLNKQNLFNFKFKF
jgi:hypothetical protein